MATDPESGFVHRGVVEGFYGPPFADEDRRWLFERIGAWGMNRYLYAPKDDPLHRDAWRDPYPEDRMREFGRWIGHGGKHGVEVGFALSPGLSIRYSSAEDVRALATKFAGFRERGARFFGLALDDVPSELQHEVDRGAFSGLASAHVALAHAVAEALGGDATLWLVPTDYLGVDATPYLEQLGQELDPRIEVGWTGRTVLSPTIEAHEARRRADLLQRRLLVWDNYPVADGSMRSMLHLGPYTGRDPELDASIDGVLLNPMQWARASAIALHTAAAYLRDARSYDPEVAWRAAIDELGGDAAPALHTFARAHRFSSIDTGDCDAELERAIARAEAGSGSDLGELRELLEVREKSPEALRSSLADRRLLEELTPWLDSHARETARMRAALDCLEVQRSDATPMQKHLAYFRLEGRLTRLPPLPHTSYGPRRVLYPQLTSMDEHAATLGPAPTLIQGRNLADRLLDLATPPQ